MRRHVTLRPATQSDNARLIDLVRSNPMQGSLDVCADWSPDAFAFARLQADQVHLTVAEVSGHVVGVVMTGESSATWNGMPVRKLRTGDLRIDHQARNGPVIRALMDHVVGTLERERDAVVVTEILKGNGAALGLNRHALSRFHVLEAGDTEVLQILPAFAPAPCEEWTYRTATLDDVAEISELLKSHFAQYELAPIPDVAWVNRQITQHTSFSHRNIHLACRNGEICALVGLWDQADLRRIVIERYSPALHAIRWILNGTRFITRMPPLPSAGEAVRLLHARWPAYRPGRQGALRDLLRHTVRHELRRGAYHCLLAAFHQSDPCAQAVHGLLSLKQEFHIFLYASRGGTIRLERVPQRPVYMDFSVI